MSIHRSRTALLALVGAAALFLSACGSDGGSDSTSAGGVTKLTVAVSPGAATSAPMYLAVKNGTFKKLGFDVKLTVLQNGTVAIPQVLNGQTQFTMASFGPVAEAIEKGLGIKLIGGANIIPTDPNTKYQAIVVNDKISSIADVKTFAAQSTDVDPVQGYAVDQLGGDYRKMKLLQLSLPELGEAVKKGNADAALLNEPFLSMALKGGGVKVLSYIQAHQSLPGTPGAVFIGSDKYMKAHPEITKKFTQGIQEAYSYAQAHLDEIAKSVPDTGLTDQVPPVIALGEYQDGPLESAKVDELLKLFDTYGVLDKKLTSADMVYQP